MQGAIIIPNVDVLGDGKTRIAVPVNSYAGGINGQLLQAIVPSIASGVSPFEGTTLFPAVFVQTRRRHSRWGMTNKASR